MPTVSLRGSGRSAWAMRSRTSLPWELLCACLTLPESVWRTAWAVFVNEVLNEYLERGMVLVFDNAEVYEELRDLLPSKGQCIFTARDQ